MPLILPELGVYVPDPKPIRDCAFPDCPHRQRGYEGHKMKVCAKCRYVRYCSKDCQRSHWRTHKSRCIPPGPYLSPTTWFWTYEGVFRWMAVEHLRLHGPDSQLHSKSLSLTVVHGKQALGQDWPSDFLLHTIHALRGSSADRRRSAQIQSEGGLGAISMSVTFTNTLNGFGPTSFMYFDFPDPVNPDYKYAPRDRVDGLVRATCNGLISLDQVEQQIIDLSGKCEGKGDVGWELLVEVRKLKAFAGDPDRQRLRADLAGRVATARQMGSKITVDEILSNVKEDEENGQAGETDVAENIAEPEEED
ncbi:hypothetical protein BDZ89DRAFT_1110010 [Hymenopellis radicata]|nr:hypothetical protein BDZ89DRAFT_1110010 [Hymenopellis radicata]